ncbi:MAG: peptidase U32 family protein [Desulfurivibrionaceae bacterium]
MIRKASRKTELLAPVGSLEAFFAALENGADAVYCGLKEFSARAKAKNFTLAEVERMTFYAHQHHRRLYIALNTLIKEQELPRLAGILADLTEIGIDGLIIQDLGVWRLAKTYFPHLPLHASTQMAVHNAAGVRMLEQMGFTRAVLARELSLAEIAAIRQQSAIELEHFVHGALCFSVSGQCLFSSAVSGMSGNRGRCAQPCRRRYLNRDQPGYHFSTSDFSALSQLPQLLKAGVMSLKIEGRMKSAEYVARVVAAYRLVLDAPESGRKQAMQEAEEQLALSFGRQATKGFLSGSIPAAIADSSRQGTLGKHLGQVTSLRGGMLGFVTADRLHVGDRIRVQPQNDQAGTGFTVRELWLAEKKTKAVKAGDFVRVRIPDKGGFFQAGDKIFKVGGKAAFTMSPEACQEILARLAVPEKSKAQQESLAQARRQALAALLPGAACQEGAAGPALTVRGKGVQDFRLLDEPGVDQLELALTPETMAALKKMDLRRVDWQGRIIWEIPPMLFGAEWDEYRRAAGVLAGQGFSLFRLNNIGHLPLFAGLSGLTLLGGFRCYALNSQAALAWGELGLVGLIADLEDDRQNLEELFRRAGHLPPLAITVYSPLPVMLSRIPVRGVRPGSLLKAEGGEGYRVLQTHGLTEVLTEQDFSLLGHLAEFKAMGCARIIVDLSHCGAMSAKGKQVLAALAADHPLPETTPFNYLRGLA